MQGSVRYRRHKLWRALTRTPVLLGAFVLVVVVAAALDDSHQPPGCHFVTHWLGHGASYSTRVCPGQARPTGPSAGHLIAVWAVVALAVPAAALVGVGGVRLWRELEVRRLARRRGRDVRPPRAG